MRGNDFMLALLLAAGMLAAWVDVRIDERRPEAPARRMLHATISCFTLFGSIGVLHLVQDVPRAAFMSFVLAVFLPALVYALLAGFWLLRSLAELARLAR